MKIIEKATMPNGTEIQLEDWSEKNTAEYPDLYGLVIFAYPIAKNSSNFIRSGEKFALVIPENKYHNYSNDDIRADFEALKSGEKSLEDLSEHFWNGRKDMFLLGMIWEYEVN